jgi:hypothetical protein
MTEDKDKCLTELKAQVKFLKIWLMLFFVFGSAALAIIVAHLHHDSFAFNKIEKSLAVLEKQITIYHAPGDKNVGKN